MFETVGSILQNRLVCQFCENRNLFQTPLIVVPIWLFGIANRRLLQPVVPLSCLCDNITMLSGAAPTIQNAVAAAEEFQEIQNMAPKRTSRGMKDTANNIMREAEKFAEQVSGTTLVDTMQTMSAQVLHTGKMDDWRVTAMHGQASPPTFEKVFQRPASTEMPCLHCAEKFQGRPVMIFLKHIDDRRGPPIGDGNWCGSACMLGYYRERHNDYMFGQAMQSAMVQKLQTTVVAPAAKSMRHWLGPHAPMREFVPALYGEDGYEEEDEEEDEEDEAATIEERVVAEAKRNSEKYDLFRQVRQFDGRFRPAAVLWHHRPVDAQQPNGQLQRNMVSMVFADSNGEVKGLRKPTAENMPPPLRSRPMQKKGLFQEFCERVEAGEDPDKIQLTIESRTTNKNIRRTRVGCIADTPTSASKKTVSNAAQSDRIALRPSATTTATTSSSSSSKENKDVDVDEDVAMQVALLPRAERRARRRKRRRSEDSQQQPARAQVFEEEGGEKDKQVPLTETVSSPPTQESGHGQASSPKTVVKVSLTMDEVMKNMKRKQRNLRKRARRR